jgi:hypothetical protein
MLIKVPVKGVIQLTGRSMYSPDSFNCPAFSLWPNIVELSAMMGLRVFFYKRQSRFNPNSAAPGLRAASNLFGAAEMAVRSFRRSCQEKLIIGHLNSWYMKRICVRGYYAKFQSVFNQIKIL